MSGTSTTDSWAKSRNGLIKAMPVISSSVGTAVMDRMVLLRLDVAGDPDHLAGIRAGTKKPGRFQASIDPEQAREIAKLLNDACDRLALISVTAREAN